MVMAERDVQDCVLQYKDMLAKTESCCSFLEIGHKRGLG